jgi:hypothetical protein
MVDLKILFLILKRPGYIRYDIPGHRAKKSFYDTKAGGFLLLSKTSALFYAQ